MLVWKDGCRASAYRFGIAGDFLPAAGLSPMGDETWSERAKPIVPLFQDLAFTVLNLECPVDIEGIAPRVKASLGDSFAARIESLGYISGLGVSVVGIANNHLYDFGRTG